MLVAVQMNLPNTGYGATRMMAAIGENNGLPLFQMLGRCREAGFALSLGLRPEAGAALRSAEAAMKQVGDTETARTYWRTSRIAWLESEGDLSTLNHMLEEARENAKSESLYFDRNLLVALCRLEARIGNRARVEEMAERFWERRRRGLCKPPSRRIAAPFVRNLKPLASLSRPYGCATAINSAHSMHGNVFSPSTKGSSARVKRAKCWNPPQWRRPFSPSRT